MFEDHTRERLRSRDVCTLLDPAIGFLFCASLSILMTVVFSGLPLREVVPFLFVVVINAAALLYGATGAIAGLLGGAFVFAFFLFDPIGLPSVRGESARTSLGWMLLLGVFVAYVFGGTEPRKRRRGRDRQGSC